MELKLQTWLKSVIKFVNFLKKVQKMPKKGPGAIVFWGVPHPPRRGSRTPKS